MAPAIARWIKERDCVNNSTQIPTPGKGKRGKGEREKGEREKERQRGEKTLSVLLRVLPNPRSKAHGST